MGRAGGAFMDGTFGPPYPNGGTARSPSGFARRPPLLPPTPDRLEPGVLMIVRNVDSVRPSALSNELVDVDPQETAEWLQSLDAVFRLQGPERAQFLLDALL